MIIIIRGLCHEMNSYFLVTISWLKTNHLIDYFNNNKNLSMDTNLITRLKKQAQLRVKQCCGSMKFWYGSGSGSADPYLWPMDPIANPDPAIFVSDLQDVNKNDFFPKFLCLFPFEGTFTSFFTIKSIQKSQTVGIDVFLTIFACW